MGSSMLRQAAELYACSLFLGFQKEYEIFQDAL